jgi:hypothetical protein
MRSPQQDLGSPSGKGGVGGAQIGILGCGTGGKGVETNANGVFFPLGTS